MLVVLGVVLVTLVLFVTEVFQVDVIAMIVLIALTILGPWTGVSPTEALSGFSNEATITVLAMLILSEGVRRTGAVQLLGQRVALLVGESERRQVAVTVGLAGSVSGFINDTPVVALLVPFAVDIADRGNTSPSKLLIPLSYGAMLGGTLTLIGTSTNLLASGLAKRLLGRSLSIFQFTPVGIVVLITGALYLVFVAPRLLPERVRPRETLVDEHGVNDYLGEFIVGAKSPLVGTPIVDVPDRDEFRGDILEVIRDRDVFRSLSPEPLQEDDVLVTSGDREWLASLVDRPGLNPMLVFRSDADVGDTPNGQVLVEAVVPTGSRLVGETIATNPILERYNAALVALRRGDVRLQRIHETDFAVGDMLLLRLPTDNLEDLAQTRNLFLARDVPHEEYRYRKIPIAIAILAGVVGLAASGLLEIQIAALLGVVAMIVSGTISPSELYENVDWTVFFLLAGIIPLGIAMESSGTAALLGALVAKTSRYFPTIVVLGLFYLMTVVLTNIISNNASVALMVPVAINTARQIGVVPLSFVLAVMFAASAAFLTPVGYQTNLFVYGPGGYKFTDYFRVGITLQLILAVVTPVVIALFFGL